MARRRSDIPPEERRRLEDRIRRRLFASSIWAGSDRIFVYLSFRDEVDTAGIVHRALEDGKRVYAPKALGRGVMEAHRLRTLEGMELGPFGIPEPPAGEIAEGLELALVPGLAFSLSGWRLGYGGGYYDRFLAREKPAWTVGLAFGSQIHEIEAEPHDVRMDALIVDGMWLKVSPSKAGRS